MGDRADLHFGAGWTESLTGELAQGGQLSLAYDPARLPQCRLNWRGAEVWDIEVAGRFHPGGSIFSQPVLERIKMPSGGSVVGLVPKPVLFDVPLGAERMELWFRNFLSAAVGGRRCEAWDSRFGEKYWYDVAPRGPAQGVRYRLGAVPDLGMVNVLAARLEKKRVSLPGRSPGTSSAMELRTVLSLVVWVRNVEYEKNVWADVHVFGPADELIHSETFTLHYRGVRGETGTASSSTATSIAARVAAREWASGSGPTRARSNIGCITRSDTECSLMGSSTRQSCPTTPGPIARKGGRPVIRVSP